MKSETPIASRANTNSPLSPSPADDLDYGDFVDSEDQGFYANPKLGRGGFSVVCLARDLKDHTNVALKVLNSLDAASQEYRIHLNIAARAKDCSGIVLGQDTSILQGLRGEHRVLVLPLRGPDFESVLIKSKRLIAVYVSAAKELLQAIISLHNWGLVHRPGLESSSSQLPFHHI
ncbi:hypothetical protein J7T55_015078 [Diaporthe amygdali]|uniref:uncharacterized protein n=1 Tax=Phomopsis amygdali TaxID=1214568 RepID=UPI0022FF0DE1|nr:uncharacterized protein J7T55_015078 [Diaporthe amygdali]KAJ0108644.1 hypothetical protein J7T55_015078 [Diaporthe amygdali]